MSIIYKDDNMEKKENDIQIIGQGTYGCIFRPNIDCGTKQKGNSDFLSKIQKNDKITNNEIEIGKKLPPKNRRFAGIIEHCPITVGEIGDKTIQKCKLTQKKTGMNLVSNKINYVGEYTLGKYLENKLLEGTDAKTQSETYIHRIINTHIYLLDSLVVLNESNVIHLDLKGNNIMIDQSKNKPVIIDFGMSYDKTLLNLKNYKENVKHPFGIAEKYYIPWCIEVIMLSHISRYLMDHKTKKIIDENKERKIIDEKNIGILQRIVSDYVGENTILKMSVFNKEEIELYKKKMTDWVKSMIGKTWSEIWTVITAQSSSWDNYSVSVMYLMELDIVGLLKSTNTTTNDFLNKYIAELKKLILSVPGERDVPKKSGESLKTIFLKVSKKQHAERVGLLSAIVDNNENKEKMRKFRTIQDNDTVQKEQYIRKKVTSKTI